MYFKLTEDGHYENNFHLFLVEVSLALVPQHEGVLWHDDKTPHVHQLGHGLR